MSFTYEFPRPAVATTLVVLCPSDHGATVLTGNRSQNANAFPGALCLPGGFVDEDEQVSHAAIRELKEETSLDIPLSSLNLFAEYSDRNIDPRCHVVNICYFVVMDKPSGLIKAGDDLDKVNWTSVDPIMNDKIELAFNHNQIVRDAMEAYRRLK